MPTLNPAEYAAWMATRPKHIQELAKKWPMGMAIPVPAPDGVDGTLYVIGWNEGGMLICSPIPLDVDYQMSRAMRVFICPDCQTGLCVKAGKVH